ncbi:hypothetical protein L1987_12107 [Smallanthus sonchifolius]|uniref:Uncharacterized protein n=1 Tax=Smallanthus sonchifolius TaxID=185202 RepID=A0ACB9JCU8_9ASTR|nr:hypothetical protein L1987_12107 [Smallanthus sonchifolius]
MPKLTVPENQEAVSGKKPRRRRKIPPPESNNVMRTVRIICHDPDMTDSSEDDGPKCKTIVREVKIPMIKFPGTCLCQDGNNSDKNLKKAKKGLTRSSSQPRITSGSRYRGVRLRESGNWAAEIRDPFKKMRVWLGTFRTPGEASQAYEVKKLEFENMAESLKIPKNPVVSEESVGLITHPSPSSVLETESSSVSRIFMAHDKKIEPFGTAVDEDFKESDLGFVEPVDEGLALVGISDGLDFGSQFLDNLVGPFDGFGNVDDLGICGFDDGESSVLPDWDFGELKNEELAWINTLRIDEPLIGDLQQPLPLSFAASD